MFKCPWCGAKKGPFEFKMHVPERNVSHCPRCGNASRVKTSVLFIVLVIVGFFLITLTSVFKAFFVLGVLVLAAACIINFNMPYVRYRAANPHAYEMKAVTVAFEWVSHREGGLLLGKWRIIDDSVVDIENKRHQQHLAQFGVIQAFQQKKPGGRY